MHTIVQVVDANWKMHTVNLSSHGWLVIPWVYIMTSRTQSVLYIGFATNLEGRVWEHVTKTERYCFYSALRGYQVGLLPGIFVNRGSKKSREVRALVSKYNPGWRNLGGESRAAPQ